MQYGHFDDAAREYVITTPQTPLPWINYLGSENFFTLLSNTAGGYSFYRDARLRRLTRYRYNNAPLDQDGIHFYVKDGDTVWNPGWQPTQTALDGYTCRHGLGYTVIEGRKDGIAARQELFVPNGENCLLCRVTLENHTAVPKELDLFSLVEWCLWDANDDATNFQRNYSIGEVEVEDSVIYHKTEYRERRDHYALWWCNRGVAGFDTSREAFCGTYGGPAMPQAVKAGQCTGSAAHGWQPIAAQHLHFSLLAGGKDSVIFGLGYVENLENKWEAPNVINKIPAKAMMARYPDDAAFDAALDVLHRSWSDLLNGWQLRSSHEKLDRMVNVWNQYQCMVTFNMSRSASYFESGMGRGMGFRDSCQDLLGFVHLIPERARERIIDIASIQFEDGSTYHQYQPLDKRGNADAGSGFNDDPLWLVACTAAYLRETGDASVLSVPTPFNNTPGSEQPLMEHLRRSVNYTFTHRGPHGLPLIGRADWNDCLNLNCFSHAPGESFQTCSNFESGKAESVFIAGMFVKYAGEYAELCRRYGDENEAEQVLGEVREMEAAVLASGWDGDWFLRAYDAFERPIGSKECDEGQIFIEPQGMCVMAGIGGEDYGQKAMNAVREQLLNDYGVELLHPCYTFYRDYLGEISSYPPGYKENGSVFCHNNSWIVMAEAELRRGEEAFDIYRRTCPAYLEDRSEIRRTEPYVYAQTVAGRDAARYGEAKNSWLTGTAAWSFVAASQGVLGIRPDYDGLRVQPAIPADMEGFRVKRLFRGTVYDITVKRGERKGITVDGKALTGDLIPCTFAAVCTVEVTI